MDPFRHITLKITCNHQTLQLYDDPDAENNTDQWARSHYVKAITGAKFEIEVAIGKHYDISQLREMDCVRIIVVYDGHLPGLRRDLLKRDIEHSRRANKDQSAVFTTTYRIDPVTKECLAGSTTFGDLSISKCVENSLKGPFADTGCRRRYTDECHTRGTQQIGQSSHICRALAAG